MRMQNASPFFGLDVEWSKALPEPLEWLREIFSQQSLERAYDVNRDDLCQHSFAGSGLGREIRTTLCLFETPRVSFACLEVD